MPEYHSDEGGRNLTSKNSTKICPITLETKSTVHIHNVHIRTNRLMLDPDIFCMMFFIAKPWQVLGFGKENRGPREL